MDMREAAEFVLNTLRKAGFEAYFAGGCVRDFVMGRTPKDFDITTNARPEQVTPLFDKTIPVGAAFGVVVVMVGGFQFEVATYRADGAYSDGRRPDEVTYSNSAEEDVKRRDFTMNGLLIANPFDALMTDYSLGVLDYVGGRDDIENRVIRCIGNADTRFKEDALRMLRAVRFVGQLGFEIEAETFKALQANVDSIVNVSRERVAEELKKLTTSKFAARGLAALASTGLLRRLLPDGVSDTRFAFTLERFAMFQTTDPVMGLAMLLADTQTNEMAALTCDSFKLSTDERDAILGAVRNQEAIGSVGSPAGTKLLAREKGVLPYAVDLFEQNIGLGFANGVEAGMDAVLRYRALTPEDIRPSPFVSGRDLIEMGFTPGPMFTTVLRAVEFGQLNGTLTTREQALGFAKFESGVQETAAFVKSEAER
jgi:poly(A) polymerase